MIDNHGNAASPEMRLESAGSLWGGPQGGKSRAMTRPGGLGLTNRPLAAPGDDKGICVAMICWQCGMSGKVP
jgi:hypothetical protein